MSMSAGLKKILPTKQKNTQCNFASKKHILLPNQHSLRNGFYRKKNRSIILTLCKNGEQSDNTWHSQDSENHRINPRTPNSKLNKTFIKESADKQIQRSDWTFLVCVRTKMCSYFSYVLITPSFLPSNFLPENNPRELNAANSTSLNYHFDLITAIISYQITSNAHKFYSTNQTAPIQTRLRI